MSHSPNNGLVGSPPTPPTESLTQIIDSAGHFIPAVSGWLDRHAFTSLGFNYSVTTVLGCQSSGKSTLLNALFGTDFPVMNAQLGRHQTTKGAWLSMSKRTKTPMAIIDVEGTDSRERGEDRMTFEHRAALFSLALADVVVVNMWYHDLGRYTASNYGLLKTVLAVNLGLFQQQADCPKTVLLFVIRDYSEAQTPLDTLHRMIYADIGSIWKEIKKPEHLVSTTADDYFEFRLVGIPSVFVDPTGFTAAVDSLRQRWEDELCPVTYSRRIPADGFAYYSQSVWETILRQAELDIPSQREMLAAYRCEEIKNAVIASLAGDIMNKLREASLGQLVDFASWTKDILNRAIEMYSGPASRYQEGVFLKKRDQLIDSMCAELQKVVDAHLSHVRRIIFEDASTELESKFPKLIDGNEEVGSISHMDSWINFTNTCEVWMTRALSRFDEIVDCINCIETLPVVAQPSTRSFASLPSLTSPSSRAPHLPTSSTAATTASQEADADQISQIGSIAERRMSSEERAEGLASRRRFDTLQAREALSENLRAAEMRIRDQQIAGFNKVLSNTCTKHFADLNNFLSDISVSPDMFWKELSIIAEEAKEDAKESLGPCWRGLQVEVLPTDDDKWEIRCGYESLRQARAELEKLVEWLHVYIINRFQALFSTDKDGVPRQWHVVKAERIKTFFVEARQSSLIVLEIIESMRLEISRLIPDPSSIDKKFEAPLLTDQKRAIIIQRATKAMQRSCQEAQILQAAAGRNAYIPIWLYLLMLALGWNELIAVVSSPATIAVMGVAMAVAALTYLTGQTALPMQLGQQMAKFAATILMPILLMFQENSVSVGNAGYPQPPPPPNNSTPPNAHKSPHAHRGESRD